MIYNDKKILLKNGKTAIIKTPSIDDAEKLLAHIKKTCEETDFLARYPEEWDSVTVENEAKWINSRRNTKNALVITCYMGDEIVGNSEINFMGGIKTSHRATVSITVLKDYWNLGIGSAMFSELIAAAEANPAIEVIELELVEGNDRARALYEKFGFQTVGERPNAFKLMDGRLLKEYFMQKEIREK